MMTRPYQSRIPVEDSYLEAAGQALYNYAYVEGVVAYLTDSALPGYINLTRGRTADAIATDLSLVADVHADEELRSVASRFKDLTSKRDALLLALPVTGTQANEQILSTLTNVATPWEEVEVWDFAQEADQLAVDSRALLQKRTGK